jgi:L-fuconolactonase
VELGAAVEPYLDMLSASGHVVGVRRLLQDEPTGFGSSDDMREGLACLGRAGLPFDVWVRSCQLPEVVTLVEATPATYFFLDHLGRPQIAESSDQWRRDIRRLAAAPNVCCNLSGLTSETGGGRRPRNRSAPSWNSRSTRSGLADACSGATGR